MPNLKSAHVAKILDNLPIEIKVQLQSYGHNLILAGGFPRDLIVGDKPSDIDLFTYNEANAKTLAEEYAKERGTNPRVFKSKNAFNVHEEGRLPVQWIFAVRFEQDQHWNPPIYTVTASFDFEMSKVAMYFTNGDWVTGCSEAFYEDVESRLLSWDENCNRPLGSIKRMVKFLNRGWVIEDDELAELISSAASIASNMTTEQITTQMNSGTMYGGEAAPEPPTTAVADIETSPLVTGFDNYINSNEVFTLGSITGRWSGTYSNPGAVTTPSIDQSLQDRAASINRIENVLRQAGIENAER
jgi:hypothetical protein